MDFHPIFHQRKNSEQIYDSNLAKMELNDAITFFEGQGTITEGERNILRKSLPSRVQNNIPAIKEILSKKKEIIEQNIRRLQEKTGQVSNNSENKSDNKIITISSEDDYKKLPSGTIYEYNGKKYRK